MKHVRSRRTRLGPLQQELAAYIEREAERRDAETLQIEEARGTPRVLVAQVRDLALLRADGGAIVLARAGRDLAVMSPNGAIRLGRELIVVAGGSQEVAR